MYTILILFLLCAFGRAEETLPTAPPSASCITEKGEGTLGDNCFCENTYFEFGNSEAANEVNSGESVKIGFIGDSGIGENSIKVLQLLKNNNVDAIVHSGDLDYIDSPCSMETNIDSVFPPNFPYFYTIGNHELLLWKKYQMKNLNRLQNVENLHCKGNLGVMSSCVFKGINIISSGAGVLCNNHLEYLETTLSESTQKWNICSRHVVHSSFQLGTKTDEVGLDIYQKCIDHGALIMTAHDHAYGRTYPIIDAFTKQINKELSPDGSYIIKPNQSIIWLNGLGGYSRFSEKNSNGDNPWWEAAYGRTTGSQYGALICTFTGSRAVCEFKTIVNTVLDTVEFKLNEDPPVCEPVCPACTKSWEPAVSDGCGGFCPQDNCRANERCSSYNGYSCVVDSSCLVRCIGGCLEEGETQPTNWCGGTCERPYC